MECNKDEALRAKSIAEGKLEKKDYDGAKKFALKVQNLYPGLDGISQMLTTLEVYISAENKINGEIDWYSVLSAHPTANDEILKKQYRKLALLLHPDKNKSVGADGAFKLISEAWALLSDKAKRLAYNQRRGFKGFQQNFTTPCAGPSAPAKANDVPRAGPSAPAKTNGFHNFTNKTTSVPKTQNTKVTPAPKPNPPKPTPPIRRTDTFWTICHRCKMHYEYLKMYLNSTLLCPNCKEAFIASETPPPPFNNKLPIPVPQRKHVPSNNVTSRDPGRNIPAAKKSVPAQQPGFNSVKPPTYHNVPFSGNKPSVATTDPSVRAKTSNAGVGGTNHSVGTKAANSSVGGTNHSVGTKAANAGVGRTDHSIGVKLSNATVGRTDHSVGVKSSNINVGRTDHSVGVKPANVTVGKTDNSAGAKSANVTVGRTDHSLGAKGASIAQQTLDKLKRAHMESHMANRWEDYLKKRKLNNESGLNGTKFNKAQVNNGFVNESMSAPGYGVSRISRQQNSTRELTPIETRNMLMAKARKEILSIQSVWKSETSTKERKKESQGHDQNGNGNFCSTNVSDKAKKARKANKDDASTVSMNVPDPDFHDFDQDRTETSFGENEVWSAYDNDDGMPRLYAWIGKVISTKPFKLKVSWLHSKTNTEFSSMDWVNSGFYKTCGEFWIGKYETCKAINSFSHRVNWSKGPRGNVIILPQKDDIWALYRNWSSDWNKHIPDEIVHKYDMVKVLEDYNKENGVSVAPLVKMVGFKTVFRPNLDSDVIKRIPKEEMLRFSHLVPSHMLTGQESENAPKGCLELDPAATPLELLQVITETNWTNEVVAMNNITQNLDPSRE